MRHPRPKPGARANTVVSFDGDTQKLSRVPRNKQLHLLDPANRQGHPRRLPRKRASGPSPLGPGELARARELARLDLHLHLVVASS